MAGANVGFGAGGSGAGAALKINQVVGKIFSEVKACFPKGPVNRVGVDRSHFSYSIQGEYDKTLLKQNNDIERAYPVGFGIRTFDARRKQLEGAPAFRAAQVQAVKARAKKYNYGVCSDMARIGYEVAVKEKVSVAHIQLFDQGGSCLHEFLFLGGSGQELKNFKQKKFKECGSTLVLDIWDGQCYFARDFERKFEALKAAQTNPGIFQPGDKLSGISVSCAHYTEGLVLRSLSQEREFPKLSWPPGPSRPFSGGARTACVLLELGLLGAAGYMLYSRFVAKDASPDL